VLMPSHEAPPQFLGSARCQRAGFGCRPKQSLKIVSKLPTTAGWQPALPRTRIRGRAMNFRVEHQASSIEHRDAALQQREFDRVPQIPSADDRSRAGSFSAKGKCSAADHPQSDALFTFRWRQKIAPDSLPRCRRRLQREGDWGASIGLRDGMHPHLFAGAR
jgi:hypothetical protein